MHPVSPLHELLYVSTLAPDAAIQVVGDIARFARIANKELDITGLLIFDGQRFCQQLEGGMKVVTSLFERICLDARHIDVRLVYQGPLAERRFRGFSMGYATVDDVDALGELEQLDGPAARDAFVELLPRVDRES